MILACTVLIQYSSVTDRQTDGQMPMPWLRCAKHFASALKWLEIVIFLAIIYPANSLMSMAGCAVVYIAKHI